MIFSPKSWFRNLIASYLTIIKLQINGLNSSIAAIETPLLAEYTDEDKAEAQIGEQWLRINSVPEQAIMGMVGGFPVINQTPAVQIRTMTSQGVI